MGTIESFALPDLGEGLAEADLLTWYVAVGDTVELNQNIAEVETAKAAVELPSPFAGTVAALRVSAGDTVEVGEPIIDIRTDTESVDDGEVLSTGGDAVDSTAPGGEERIPVLVGYGVAQDGASRRRGRTVPVAAEFSLPPNGRPLASPPVRALARESGIDLVDVPATGGHGEITRDDLERFGSAAHHPAGLRAADHPVAEHHGAETRQPIRGVRKHTADAMVRSAFSAPHVTEFLTVDITAGLELVESLKSTPHFAGVKLSPLGLVAKAVVVALKSNPMLNSTWDEAAQDIVVKHYVNLGIAAATPRGLMVPNVKGADRLGFADLARAVAELTSTAKEGKSSPADLADGTITITNVGVFGVDAGTPILNPGEAAILCFGAIRRQPWEYQGEIALRSITTLSLSFDHRIVDGQQGSQFLSLIGQLLTDPVNLVALS